MSERLPGQPDKNGWIRCSERMPEEDVSIIVKTIMTHNKTPAQAAVARLSKSNGKLRFANRGEPITPDIVTHWQPLPDPPEEG